MSHPNQQQQHNKQQNPQQEWKPTARTYFLLLSDPEFERRARKHIEKRYGRGVRNPQTGDVTPWRIVSQINGSRLIGENTIVALYQDPDRGIRDEKTGEWRDRDPGLKEKGQWVREPEPPMVLESKPIDCRAYWREGGEDGDGVELKALVRAITAAVHPCRCQLTDRVQVHPRDGQNILTLVAV